MSCCVECLFSMAPSLISEVAVPPWLQSRYKFKASLDYLDLSFRNVFLGEKCFSKMRCDGRVGVERHRCRH